MVAELLQLQCLWGEFLLTERVVLTGLGFVVVLSLFCFLFASVMEFLNPPRILDLDDGYAVKKKVPSQRTSTPLEPNFHKGQRYVFFFFSPLPHCSRQLRTRKSKTGQRRYVVGTDRIQVVSVHHHPQSCL